MNLKVILNCHEISVYRNNDNPNFDFEKCSSALNYYGSHPAVIGWHIVDEPSKNAHFSTTKPFSDAIHNYSDNKIRFSNLYPNYSTKNQLEINHEYIGPQANIQQYKNYIKDFINITNPNFLSVDHYPMSGNTNYFQNLQILSSLGKEYNLPYFIMFTPRMPSGEGKKIAEFNYVIFSNLVYGSKGIFYWAREGQAGGCGNGYSINCSNHSWLGSKFWDNLVSQTTKESLKELHGNLIDNGDLLFSLELKNVYHYSTNTGIGENQTTIIPSQSNWQNLQNDLFFNSLFDAQNPIETNNNSNMSNFVISFMEDKYENNYFWIFNKSIKNGLSLKLNFNDNYSILNQFENELTTGAFLNAYLEKGEGQLFRVVDNFEIYINVCNKTYWTKYPDVFAKKISLGGNNCNINFLNNSEINFYGEEIYINKNVSFQEGCNVKLEAKKYIDLGANLRGRNEIDNNSVVKIYPNPSKGNFKIDSEDIINRINIYDSSGRLIFENGQYSDKYFPIKTNLRTGIYFIELSNDKKSYISSLVIQ
ncbi:MAG: T9SS type A sorting domain-containing protein [Flavobacteriales bacterium]|nr:T9SS type A sorting domain-containing protein [Flavobacteriales bacterium]